MREFLEARIEALAQQNRDNHAEMQAFNAQARNAMIQAIAKAEASIEKRFEAVADLRQQLNEIAMRMYPRVEAETAIRSGVERAEALAKALGEKMEARARAIEDKSVTGYANLDAKFSSILERAGAVSVENSRRISELEGRRSGIGEQRSTLLAILALVLSLVVGSVSIWATITAHNAIPPRTIIEQPGGPGRSPM